MSCITKECIRNYLDKLEREISEYMELPLSQRSSEAVDSMLECWDKVYSMMDNIKEPEGMLTLEEAESWNSKMQNADGSYGGHWTIEQTNEVSKPAEISSYCWNVTMNMMYSDYCKVAAKHGVDNLGFYVDFANAFLFDTDGGEPGKKLKAYYKNIVCMS